jgi:hypothetical protein
MNEVTSKNGVEPVIDERFLISDLCDLIAQYMDQEQVKEVYRAYLFGAQAHEGQHRVSGEPYIYHPIAVARILASMHMDVKSIVASILHDVLEDTPATRKLIAKDFGEDVAALVDGVSKLTHIKFKNKIEQQAENIQKVLLAMAKDIRVIMIKLADRLHNMRTLDALEPVKRRRIAQETLDIYIPIANRLGIYIIRHELENLVFKAIHPIRYRVLGHAVDKARGHRHELIDKINQALRCVISSCRLKRFSMFMRCVCWLIQSMIVTVYWVSCTTCSNQYRVASKIISQSLKVTVTSHCIPPCTVRTAFPWKCRCGRWRWTSSPRAGSLHTGCINHRTKKVRSLPTPGRVTG